MIAFVNSFLTYLLIFVIMSTIVGIGIFIGITLRKHKNTKGISESVTETEKVSK